MWRLSYDDAELIAIGAGILGTGGGGNPYLGMLRLQGLIKQGYEIDVVDPDSIPDDALAADVGAMGAPTVGIEKLEGGEEERWALEALEQYIGKRIDYIICAEVGGSNSVVPLVAAALTGKPVVDSDAMGRAFPELQMSTYFIDGAEPFPLAMVDEKNNRIVLDNVQEPKLLERFARDLCIHMGCRAMLSGPVFTGEQVKRLGVPRTLSLAKRVGAAVIRARHEKAPIAQAVLAVTGGVELFQGKLIDVARRTTGGFARGDLVAEGLGDHRGTYLHIAFQNENLVAWRGGKESRDEVLVAVPDLICLLETETGEPITTEQLRYGLRVTALGIPCTPRLRTPQALKVVGPAAFGYPDVTFTPLPLVPGIGLAD